MKLSVQNDLTFGDITGKVRDRVSDIIVWHGQDRDLGYGTRFAFYDTRTFVQGCKLTVQITRITFTGRNLTFGGGNLSHGLAEGCDVCQDDQDVHSFFKSKILCGSEGNLRCKKTFNNRIICKIQEHNYMVCSTAFLEGTAEKFRYVIFDTHCRENNGKIFIRVLSQRSLLYDLCSQLVVWKTISGKDRKLLSSDQGGQSVDCGNTGVDIVSGIFTCYRVQRQTIDV